MKIAIFTDVYVPWGSGGIVSSILAQKAELEKLGNEVTVFSPGLEEHGKDNIVVPSHKTLRINGSVVAKRPSVVEAYILEQCPDFAKFDLVHVHYEASCSIAGIRLAKKFGIPLVQTMHGREDMAITANIPHPLKFLTALALSTLHAGCLPHEIKIRRDKFQAPTLTRALMWRMMVNHAEAADVVLTPADHLAKKLEHYGMTRPMMVVPNGIPEELVNMDFAERKLADGDVLKMVWNSRVSHEKRIMPFLQAVAEMRRPYVLYVYGDGNALRQAKTYAKRHKLKVKFYGACDRKKIIARMREAHLSILASYNFDTQGMVLIEAEATGLPVFFCDPTLCEVVPQGGYVLANGRDATAMAITLDNLAVERIGQMSAVMLKHRKEVLQTEQVKKLLAAYKIAKEKAATESATA